MSVGLVAMMWLYNPLLATLALGVMLIYAVMRSVAYRLYRAASEEAIVYAAQEHSHFIETLRGMPSIKALVIGDRRQASWNNYLVDEVGADLQGAEARSRVQDGEYPAVRAGPHPDHLLRRPRGDVGVAHGRDAGRLPGLQGPVLDADRHPAGYDCEAEPSHTPRRADRRHRARGTGGRRWRGATALTPASTGARRGKAALSARGISFRYGDNEPPVLADFDFDVAPGECVAIVGPSGAGKTTLLKILAGLLRPSTGSVLLDDVPVQAMGLENYRSQIGCVLQDDRLFAGSIADNIAAFSPSPDPERVQHAARLAAIHEEILRMPMGYETLVGDMGSSLSGGQIQRIVLARALYRGPRLLLLDEATSHLDEDNERTINGAIRSLPIARIIVAHRRSTIEMADRIVPIWPMAAAGVKRVGVADRDAPS